MFGEVQIRYNRLHGMDQRIRQQAARVVKSYALQGEGMVKASMAEPKSGRMYGDHQASAPGESPAIDIGHLAASVQASEESALAWEVAVNADYGIYLEYGTVHMAPRPYMAPMAEALRGPFISDMRNVAEGAA